MMIEPTLSKCPIQPSRHYTMKLIVCETFTNIAAHSLFDPQLKLLSEDIQILWVPREQLNGDDGEILLNSARRNLEH